jgi:hypothetical protein
VVRGKETGAERALTGRGADDTFSRGRSDYPRRQLSLTPKTQHHLHEHSSQIRTRVIGRTYESHTGLREWSQQEFIDGRRSGGDSPFPVALLAQTSDG